MDVKLTFEDVCKYVQSHHSEMKDDVHQLISIGLIFGVPIVGSQVSGFASSLAFLTDFFSLNDEIKNISGRIFAKITQEKAKDTLDRYERMRIAYGLICYTSFFEAFEHQYSEIAKIIQLQNKEKIRFSNTALDQISLGPNSVDDKSNVIRKYSHGIELPHPTGSLKIQIDMLSSIYEIMSKNLLDFLKKLIIWEELELSEHELIKGLIDELPKAALSRYKSQCFVLASKYEEFYVWLSLYELQDIQANFDVLSDELKSYTKLAETNQQNLETSFKVFSKALLLILKNIEKNKVDKTFTELGNLYKSYSQEPVIISNLDHDSPQASLQFPKKLNAYIPQLFKVLRYSGNISLGNEEAWNPLSPRNDIGLFLAQYIISPHSVLTPLIILGHPGSGKSLLTTILADRLHGSSFLPIHVQLRNVNADADIIEQIEEQIYRDTSRHTHWADLVDSFDHHPAVVILDGYDELLQASGKVFASYLKRIQRFQENEIKLGRSPVRVIVTSRLMLIDTANIPDEATVIRLLEFDSVKRQQWITLWNTTNEQYFRAHKVDKFQIPGNQSNILDLARQPLLLQMLAIYDADNNNLRKTEELDKTSLYSNLIRRFVEREKEKSPQFYEMREIERETEIEAEIDRLGVAAIGMFNRKMLYIQKHQLDEDLDFYEPQLLLKDDDNTLQADFVLGSFFFIHEARSINVSKGIVNKTYEFLHNTFGEFLTAEFIIKRVLIECQTLESFGRNDSLRRRREQYLTDPNSISNELISCLIYTPLFSRPVILNMMSERLGSLLEKEEFDKRKFLQNLEALFLNQLNHILNGDSLPFLISDRKYLSLNSLPIIGYSANYTVNLLLILSTFSEKEYALDERQLTHPRSELDPWTRLTRLWRSWFSLENMQDLASILQSTKEDPYVYLDINSLQEENNPNIDIDLALDDIHSRNVLSNFLKLLTHNDKNSHSLNSLLEEILHYIKRTITCDSVGLYILDSPGHYFLKYTVERKSETHLHELHVNDFSEFLEEGLFIISDTSEKIFSKIAPFIVGVQLGGASAIDAIVVVSFRSKRRISKTLIATLHVFRIMLNESLQNLKLINTFERVRYLTNLAGHNSSLSPASLCSAINEIIGDQCLLFRVENDNFQLIAFSSADMIFLHEELLNKKIPLSKAYSYFGSIDHVVRTQSIRYMRDVRQHADYVELNYRNHILSQITVPLIIGNEVVGVLIIESKSYFADEDSILLLTGIIAQIITLAWSNINTN